MPEPVELHTQSATGRERIADVLRESEEKFRSIFRDARVGMLLISLDGRFVEVNRAICEFLGYSEEELLRKDIASITYSEDLAQTNQAIERVFREGRSLPPLKKRYLHKDGRPRWGEVVSSIVRGPDGNAKYHLAQVTDIKDLKWAEVALKSVEARYAELIDSVRAIVWSADARTFQTTFASKHAEEILGYPLESWLGTPNFWIDHVHPEDREQVIAFSRGAIAEKRKHEFEVRMVAADGRTVWLRTIVNVLVENDQPLELVGFSVDVTERKKAEEAMASFSGRLIEAQEKERSHIARELHDDVGQHLAILAIELQKINSDLPADLPAPLRGEVKQSMNQILKICDMVRDLSHGLHSSKLELLGLVAGMNGFCQEFSEQQEVRIEFTHRNVPKGLPQPVSLCLYRILQEGLWNAAKHSRCKEFAVHVEAVPELIQLTIRDGGVGFDLEAAIGKQGLGLASMRERVSLLRGTLRIVSVPKTGTELKVQLPLG